MKVLIVGAGYAGIHAALRIARRAPKAQITLVGLSPRFEERIRLHEHAVGKSPWAVSLPRLLKNRSIRFIVGKVERIERQERTAWIRELPMDDTTPLSRLDWDQLVLALGSVPKRAPIRAKNVFHLSAQEAQTMSERLFAMKKTGGRVVVVGGGLTGIEAATEIAETYPKLEVHLVSRGSLGAEFSRRASQVLRQRCAVLNIRIHSDLTVTRVGQDTLRTEEKDIQFDLCVWATGFVGPKLPEGLALDVDSQGRLQVLSTLQSVQDECVFVAGDLAAHPHSPHIVAGCKSAIPSGARAGENVVAQMVGRRLRPFRFWAPVFCVSLGRRAGLIQCAAPDGTMTGRVIRGRWGALIKELICRSTRLMFAFERWGVNHEAMFERAPKQLPLLTETVT